MRLRAVRSAALSLQLLRRAQLPTCRPRAANAAQCAGASDARRRVLFARLFMSCATVKGPVSLRRGAFFRSSSSCSSAASAAMPELPEVESARGLLQRHAAGRTITAVTAADDQARLSLSSRDARRTAARRATRRGRRSFGIHGKLHSTLLARHAHACARCAALRRTCAALTPRTDACTYLASQCAMAHGAASSLTRRTARRVALRPSRLSASAA